jgi:hypothetical protein
MIDLVEVSQNDFCIVLLPFLCVGARYGDRGVIVPPPVRKPLAVVYPREGPRVGRCVETVDFAVGKGRDVDLQRVPLDPELVNV